LETRKLSATKSDVLLLELQQKEEGNTDSSAYLTDLSCELGGQGRKNSQQRPKGVAYVKLKPQVLSVS
jgi:hypothetical protein